MSYETKMLRKDCTAAEKNGESFKNWLYMVDAKRKEKKAIYE